MLALALHRGASSVYPAVHAGSFLRRKRHVARDRRRGAWTRAASRVPRRLGEPRGRFLPGERRRRSRGTEEEKEHAKEKEAGPVLSAAERLTAAGRARRGTARHPAPPLLPPPLSLTPPHLPPVPPLGAGDGAPSLGAEGRGAARGRLSGRAPVPSLGPSSPIWLV